MSTLIDTNVLSELLRAQPDAAVVAWFAAQPQESLFVAAVTEAEMRLGARLLPNGRRRHAIERALTGMFENDLAQRVLPFDREAVPAYVDERGGLRGRRPEAGRPPGSSRPDTRDVPSRPFRSITDAP